VLLYEKYTGGVAAMAAGLILMPCASLLTLCLVPTGLVYQSVSWNLYISRQEAPGKHSGTHEVQALVHYMVQVRQSTES
jgi:hypothetical protein